METTDSHFFTNRDGVSVEERLKKILENSTKHFDVIVGYFYITGFYKLWRSLKKVDKIRILVGIGTDKTVQKINQTLSLFSEIEAKKLAQENLVKEIKESDENPEMEEGILKFIEYLESGKMEIRAYPNENLHAKVYIMLKEEGAEDYGKVITGSSNFTSGGLNYNLEFNVELKDYPDVKFAENKFNELWSKSVPLSDLYVETIRTKTYLNDKITPYELYLKTLYEYFGGIIEYNLKDFKFPESFKILKYQTDAVKQAVLKLYEHNGVFLSDVVGLGKTYISAMIAKELENEYMPLIVSPPTLIKYWEDTMREFGIAAKVISSYKLNHLKSDEIAKYGIVFIDEAHSFRTEDTERYTNLHIICAGKKVVLISATPLNNAPKDIANQIFLFENKYNSTIPGIKNLGAFFSRLQARYDRAKAKYKQEGTPEAYQYFIKESRMIAKEMRDKVLKHIMIRRTRNDVIYNYKEDLKQQGISFPDLEDPQILFYKLDQKLNNLFNKTVKMISPSTKDRLQFTRYKPLMYLKEEGWDYLIKETHQLEASDRTSRSLSESQLVGLLKVLLLKRLDSSFESFRQTLSNLIKSYQNMINMLDHGTIYISKELKVFDFLKEKSIEELDKFVENLGEDYSGLKVPSKHFRKEFRKSLQRDIEKLTEIKNKWSKVETDPKIDTLINSLQNESVLSKEKIIIFTEFEDTEKYIIEEIKKKAPEIIDKTIAISNKTKGEKIEEVLKNFDPNIPVSEQDNKYRILISTDILSEGLNLNKAKAIINYDIPWNPTRIIQRFGRINRIGTTGKIFIYNFLPTEETETEINLKASAKGKIEMFIEALGADAKYLTKDIIVNSEGLFEILTSKKLFEEDSEINEEITYLQFIRAIKEKCPKLFESLKGLPAKARTTKKSKIPNSVLTYFKIGSASKFVITNESESREVAPIEAFKTLRCSPKEPLLKLPRFFWEFYAKNKLYLKESMNTIEAKKFRTRGENALLQLTNALVSFPSISNTDREYLQRLKNALIAGALTNLVVKDAVKKAQREIDTKNKIEAIKNIIDEYYLKESIRKNEKNKRSVILSEALIKGGT